MNYQKIKKIMNSRDYTYEDLSHLSKIPMSTLTKIGSGITANPGYDTMLAIAKALNCSMDEFSDRQPLVPYDLEEYAHRFNQLPSCHQEYIKYVINTEYDRQLYLSSKDKISLQCFEFTNIVDGLADYESRKIGPVTIDRNYLSEACSFCVLLKTNVLSPKFFKNSLLGFHYDDACYPKQGEIWIIRLTNGYLYIGRYYKSNDIILLKALNGTIEDINLSNHLRYKRIGKFLGLLRAPS